MRIVFSITLTVFALLGASLIFVLAADGLPESQAVLPKDYTNIFRRPQFAIVSNDLMLFWQRPSPGARGEQPIKVIYPNGEERTETRVLPGNQPAKVEYAIIATAELQRKLPLKSPLGVMELPEPGRKSPTYSLVRLPDATASLLLGYESGLSHTLLNEFLSVTFQSLTRKDDTLSVSERWTLPKRVRFPWPREGVERYMKSHGLTEEQVLAQRGTASLEEYSKDYANPTLALNEKDNVLLCVGTVDQGIHPDVGNIWIVSSTDGGKTWAPQAPLGWGLMPTLAVRDGEVFVVATDRVRGTLIPDYMWGYWPDEWTKGPAWPVLGKPMLWRWRWGEVLPKEPVVAVNEPKAVQNTLVVRDDGLLVLVYAKTEYVGSTTSLWLTTSHDGIKWDTPRQLTDGKFLDRDASGIFYRGTLWIAFARTEGKLPSSIYLMKYDQLPPLVDKAGQETKAK